MQLSDLRFADNERVDLIKRYYAAQRALEEGKTVDCLRLVDDYWPRYLMEHVPPAEQIPVQTARAPGERDLEGPESARPDEKKPGFGSKLRGWVPKVWR